MGFASIIIESYGFIFEDVIYDSDRYKIAVDTTHGNTGQGSSYFKFYDKRNKEIARILITEPTYTRAHKNDSKTSRGGEKLKSTTTLSNTQKKKLIEILKEKPNNGEYKNMDNTYQAVAYAANKVSHVSKTDIKKYKDSNLEDTPQNIIPYNMEMPNYMEL